MYVLSKDFRIEMKCVSFGPEWFPTCATHYLAGNLLITAPGAEDLAADTTVMFTTEGSELLATVVALLAD